MKRVPSILGMLLILIAATAAANTAPTITAASPVTLTAGDPTTSVTVATVSDAEDSAGSLTVNAISIPSGISVGLISNHSGTITATITVACWVTPGENGIVFQVVDSGGATANATFIVNASINAAPSKPTITATENGTGTTDQACPEQPLTLTASSIGATSYQWYSNNDAISGATSSTYSATGAATYYVLASNACYTSWSDGYVVSNPTPHKANLSVISGSASFCSGGSATLWSDSATGIQWYKDGVAIAGATSESYVATTSGSYTVVLDALGCHTAQSDPLVVTVYAMPSTPTISATENGTGTSDQACPEEPLTLTATSNTVADAFQWYSDNAPISGATSSTLTVTAAGNYSAVATNAYCTSSRSATYTVSNPTPHKATLSVINGTTNFCAGGSVTLWSDSATGIQWYKDGAAISGATSESYVATTSGSYTVILDALGCHSQESDPIIVTVDAMPDTPTISATANGTGTTDQACPEEPLTLTATSNNATSFQWYSDDAPISGATSSTLTVTAFGNYSATATNGTCTTARSSTYTVQNPTPHKPTLSVISGSTTFCAGGSVTLWSDSATGIQWYKDGVAISGANSESYVATASGSYSVILDALGCHSQQSDAIVVTVSAYPDMPTISATENGTGTTDQACPAQPLTLTATSNGATSFQWYSDDAPISGATSSTLTVTAFGNYSVTATNGLCTTGRSSTYTVQNPTPHKATLSVISGTADFCSGGSVTLWSDSATGIQWYKDGVAISGANSESYVATVSGSYTVILDALGCTSQESDPIVVTVTATPDTPTISATENGTGTTDQACPEEPLTLTATSNGATSFQWFADGGPINGATSATYTATGVGDYTVVAYNGTCSSATSSAYTVHNPTPHKANLSAAGATTFCTGGSVTLWSDSATGIQWYKDGVAIAGAGSQSYVATVSGSYTAVLDALGCHTAQSDPIVVTVNPIPSTPTVSGPDTTYFCAGGGVTLTSSSASGNQWYQNGVAIGGATGSSYLATVGGDYTVVVTTNGCSSATSNSFHVDGNVTPHKPFVSASGPTTFCAGGSVTLWSDSATGIQWYKDGVAISGAGAESYVATESGSYTCQLNALGCPSPVSDAIVVTVNAVPSTPTITPAAATSFCTGGNATLTSSSTSGNQWYLNGTAISGATSQTYVATMAGDYTVVVTSDAGCSSATSSATTVTINPYPDATLTAPYAVVTGSTGNSASVPDAGAGATYTWTISGGTITAGSGTNTISFTAGAVGTLTLNVTVTTAAGCSSSASSNTIVAVPVVISTIHPSDGSTNGGKSVTIEGSGFATGATVTFGGTAATNVTVVSSTKITATTPAHAAGAVDVTVTDPNTISGTLTGGFTYHGK